LGSLLHQFSDWYLSVLGQGGYWLIAGLMALESTFVPIPSEVIIPPAAYLAHTQGQFSLTGIILAGTVGSCLGASIMYWGSRLLGRPLIVRFGPYVGLGLAKLELAEAWSARYEWAGVFFSRLLPVIRHLIGIPVGILRMDFRWYLLATAAGSLLWTSVLAWLGESVGAHPELLTGSLHKFFAMVAGAAVVLLALYYFFVQRPAKSAPSKGS
jgi:membrane protein DedA with SNARE-associated domain